MPDINANDLWSLRPDPAHEDVILIGGPKDGLEFAMRSPTTRLRFPMALQIHPTAKAAYLEVLDQMHNGIAVQALAYELEFHQGHLSRDDRGRLRYVYRGIVEL